MRWAVRTFAAFAIGSVLAVAAPVVRAQPSEAETSIALPVSFDKVWFRPGRDSGLGSGKQSGLLTVSESGLEFSAKKQSHVLPWSRIEMISYGRMSGDIDTKWVVLALNPVAEQWSFIGYRDGQKLGYGRDTTKVFDTIVEGLRRANAGPFAVTQGYSVYITPFLQFTLAVPEGWHPYAVSDTYVQGRPMWGRTIFSPVDLKGARNDEARTRQALAAIHDGSERAVFLDRFEAGEGFSCRRLGKAGRRKLREEIAATLRPLRLVAEPQWTPHPHRYCTAWTFVGRAIRDDTAIDVAFYAVSDDQTAYLFATRAPADTAIDEQFEPVSRSLRTAVAR